MRPGSIILVLLILVCGSSFAQTGSPSEDQERINALWDAVYYNPDSLGEVAKGLWLEAQESNWYLGKLNALQLIGEYHYLNDRLDSSLYYYSRSMDIAIAEGDRNEIAHCHTSLASLSADFGDKDGAIEHFKKSLQVRLDDQDTTEICDLAIRYANCLGDFDIPDEAMEKYFLGLACCRAVDNDLTIGHAYNGMAIVHKKQKNFDKALELLDSAAYYYGIANDDFYVAATLNNRGVLYKQLGRYSEAMKDYEAGLKVMEEMGYSRGVMSFDQNMGILANLQDEPDLALIYCGKSLAIANEIHIPPTISEALNEISKALLKKGDLTAAEDSIDKAISIAQEIKSLEKEHQAWETKSLIHKAQGRTKDALNAYQQYVLLNDSMFKIEKTAEIDRLQTEYETEKKEAAIKHLESEAELEKERKQWLIIGLIAMAIAAITIILSVIQKRRKDRSLHQAQLELKDSENQRLEEQLQHKRRELTEKALHLAQKNELLISLEEDIKLAKQTDGAKGLSELQNKLRFDKQIDQNWEQFTMAFTETNKDFFKRLSEKHADLTKNELRLSALLTMNLSSKELGAILNVSDEGIKKARYRLRKKFELATEDGLEQYLGAI